jgi:flagellar biosynthesis/type III secretory pathway chaperone
VAAELARALSMDQVTCRGKLGQLIFDEGGALRDLAVLLDREHGYLEANDVVSLEGATGERQLCVARICRVDEERRALCGDMGYTLDLDGLERLIRWCDPSGTLAGGWTECSAAAARCRELNDRNGALVAARLQHVQARLGTLIESHRETVTYGPRGAYSQASSGRVVATEA